MSERPLYYTLDGTTPVPEPDLHAFAQWFAQDPERRTVKRTVLSEAVTVSTVFLGIDHNHWGDGPPILFETMAWIGGSGYTHQERYATYDEAVQGHNALVARLRTRQTRRRSVEWWVAGVAVRVRRWWR